jgi:hypothetical protein
MNYFGTFFSSLSRQMRLHSKSFSVDLMGNFINIERNPLCFSGSFSS